MTYIPEALRRLVAERAANRCEYCLLHQDHTYFTHEVDHIYAEKHGGDTTAENLCIACADCNRYKGSDLCSLDSVSGRVEALYHPRQQTWGDYFRLLESGLIEPTNANGRVTERILRFNRAELVAERRRLIRLGHYKDFVSRTDQEE